MFKRRNYLNISVFQFLTGTVKHKLPNSGTIQYVLSRNFSAESSNSDENKKEFSAIVANDSKLWSWIPPRHKAEERDNEIIPVIKK